MEPTTLNDDVGFLLPPEFLSDDDFEPFKSNESNLFTYDELSHGFGLDSGFGSTVKQTGLKEDYLTGFTRKKMSQSSLEDDFSGGFYGNHTGRFLCGTGGGYGRWNQNCQASDLYCAAVEKLATMNISDESYGYNRGRGINYLPRKHPHVAAAVKNPNDGGSYYNRQSLQYQKLQALKFQHLKLMQQSRGLKANNNKIAPSVWSNHQPQERDVSGMRAVFLGDRTGKPRSTGTGVFLPRHVNHTHETREKPTLATVLVPARVAEVLNLDESVVQQPLTRSPASLYEASWRQKSGFSSQMKMDEHRLPSDWAY